MHAKDVRNRTRPRPNDEEIYEPSLKADKENVEAKYLLGKSLETYHSSIR